MKIAKQCPFCGHEIVKTSNKEIYGKEYGNGQCYLCKSCRASVGTHPNGEPLGILANREMKILKRCCHDLFDYTWKSRKLTRNSAYKILSEKLGISINDCHFGHFNTDILLKAIEILKESNWYEE
ncbi:hypothetical protein K144312032_14500 [Clostridium tetani]|uniref:zinc-finger-containing protein n=1 Tax=Clostridium tetani TaxID=1513 RepID=UPI00100B2331|nr:zinc-finger-containing protein [Clostridium tetani]RXM68377.1 hypothetical protein DP139_12415 [Clostridium tetani]BDR67222.1 hypothetical protein K144312032_14500 [Clostridium tetani]